MKKLIIMTLIMALCSFSCIKGNPEDYPRINMTDIDLFGLMYSNSSSVVAIQFDPILHDPEIGPMLLENLKDTPSSNIPEELMSEFQYVHGMTVYSLGPNPMFLGGGPLTDAVFVVSAEFNPDRFTAALKEKKSEVTSNGYILYKVDDEAYLAILNDRNVLLGEKAQAVQFLEGLSGPETLSGQKTASQPQLTEISSGTFLFSHVNLSEIYNKTTQDNDTDHDIPAADILKEFGVMQISATISGDEVVMEIAIETKSGNQDDFQERLDRLIEAMNLTMSGDTEPEYYRESWGVRILQKTEKINLFKNMSLF